MDPEVAGPAAAALLALRLPAEGERGAGGVSAGEAGAAGRAGRRRPRVHLGSPAPAAGPGTLRFPFPSPLLPFPSRPARRSAGSTAPSPGPARTGGAAGGGRTLHLPGAGVRTSARPPPPSPLRGFMPGAGAALPAPAVTARQRGWRCSERRPPGQRAARSLPLPHTHTERQTDRHAETPGQMPERIPGRPAATRALRERHGQGLPSGILQPSRSRAGRRWPQVVSREVYYGY